MNYLIRSVVIDNKDYNYTLIISGQNIQVIHHDTNRNITYRHGIDVRNLQKFQFSFFFILGE